MSTLPYTSATRPPAPIPRQEGALMADEAEENLLGYCLCHPESIHDIADYIEPDDFFFLRNRWVFEALLKIRERGETVEYTTVTEELKMNGKLNDVGGLSYITLMITRPSIYATVMDYAKPVKRAAGLRRYLDFANQIENLVKDGNRDYAAVEAAIDALYLSTKDKNAKITTSAPHAKPLSQIAREVHEETKERLHNPKKAGVSTGWYDVDKVVGEFQAGDFILIGFDTGGGKSVAGMTITKNATALGQRGLYVTLEMTEKQHLQRYTAAYTGISAQRQRNLDLDPAEQQRILDEYMRIARDENARRLYVADRSDMTTLELRTTIKRVVRELGRLDYIFIDHINLLNPPPFIKNDVAPKMKYIAEDCKKIAKDYQTCVFGLVQFRNDIPLKHDTPPTISHLYGGAAVKQSADVILIGHRPEMYLSPSEQENAELKAKYENLVDVHCVKFREGDSNWKASLTFLKEKSLFVNRPKGI